MQGNAVAVLDLLESRKIPFVTLERGFRNVEAIKIGKPQQKYKHWLGAVTYDDKASGALLTSALYKQHLKNSPLRKLIIGNFQVFIINKKPLELSIANLMLAYSQLNNN